MMFSDFVKFISSLNCNFKEAANEVREYIDQLDRADFLDIVRNIGMIPESIEHDSSEEKLYSKASDIVLARCFRMLGLASKALDERADSADIIAESVNGYNYSLVADAKCFRLSRTAKNQKDFKISNLSNWRGADNEYAVLVAPYFQYPQTRSQIYATALALNVCLITWEHISLLLEFEVRETEKFSLESLWNASSMMARDSSLAFSNAQVCFLPKMDKFVAKKIGVKEKDYVLEINKYKTFIIFRGKKEIEYWYEKIEEIRSYTKEKAIEELISAKKLNEKIGAIKSYLNKLEEK